ncbi:Ff.00g128780.m01.CDS01 [Fusarium sp. VM40]|nr:Ff.00g128780.m01.CDS01 [Fusarium sp. VM40]
MDNQPQNDANRITNRVQDRGRTLARHPHYYLGMQPGLPRDAGNDNQHTPNNPSGPDRRHGTGDHPGPIPYPDPVQIDTSQEFITSPFPPLTYRKFTVHKTISSAEWVSANTDIIYEMRQRDRQDVAFRERVRHRISPDLWPIIPLVVRPFAYEWLTESQRATLGMPPPGFQTQITIVEEHEIPPHPNEACYRALEREISNLPKHCAYLAALMKFELNDMFTRHLHWIRRLKNAQKWLNQQIDQTRQSTLATWINSWTGRDDGMRPPL